MKGLSESLDKDYGPDNVFAVLEVINNVCLELTCIYIYFGSGLVFRVH